jgi:hypothetical protein
LISYPEKLWEKRNPCKTISHSSAMLEILFAFAPVTNFDMAIDIKHIVQTYTIPRAT